MAERETHCPECGRSIGTDETTWPGQAADQEICQECWEASCDESWWELVGSCEQVLAELRAIATEMREAFLEGYRTGYAHASGQDTARIAEPVPTPEASWATSRARQKIESKSDCG
jgi:tRNA G26 N,N-dimethylase Trm1